MLKLTAPVCVPLLPMVTVPNKPDEIPSAPLTLIAADPEERFRFLAAPVMEPPKVIMPLAVEVSRTVAAAKTMV